MPDFLEILTFVYLGTAALIYVAILWIYIKCEIIEGTKPLWWRIEDISFGLLILNPIVAVIWPIWFFSLSAIIVQDQLEYWIRNR